MAIQLAVTITDEQTTIHFDEAEGEITIYPRDQLIREESAIALLYAANQLVAVQNGAETSNTALIVDHVIIIKPTWDIDLDYLTQRILDEAATNGLELGQQAGKRQAIPKSSVSVIEGYYQKIATVLATFGYSFKAKEDLKLIKKKPGKAQHRWRKEISELEFTTDFRGSHATAIWHKRNEMLLKAGAKLMETAPLNKDGSVGFAAKMGDKIRSDNQEKISNFVTTEDIILKSVNEVGLFLYFGGTNSWLELLDKEGKSIDDWTRVD